MAHQRDARRIAAELRVGWGRLPGFADTWVAKIHRAAAAKPGCRFVLRSMETVVELVKLANTPTVSA